MRISDWSSDVCSSDLAATAPGNSARFRSTLMSSSSSLSALYVRDGRGRYQRAEADQILEAARRLVDQRLQRGVTLSDPSVAKEFLRLRMATLEHAVFVRSEETTSEIQSLMCISSSVFFLK